MNGWVGGGMEGGCVCAMVGQVREVTCESSGLKALALTPRLARFPFLTPAERRVPEKHLDCLHPVDAL